MAAVVKEELEAPYSLPLLLSDRNPRCRAMTASVLSGAPPPPPQTQQSLHSQTHTSIQQHGNQQVPQQNSTCQQSAAPQHNSQHPHQPLTNGLGQYDRVPVHSPSSMPSVEPSKRHPSPNKPPANDPLSHRIIEKRRRDRMNNCLADLSRLIPTYYLKKGRGRIEKTEIIEMAIKYMKHLQAHACNQIENCDVTAKQERAGNQLEQFHLGYRECMSETMQFLVESEGFFSGDSLCVRLMNHLTKHCEKILTSEGYVMRQSGTSVSSSSSGYHANSSSAGSSSDGNGSGSSHAPEKESAYRSEDRPISDDREDKSVGSSVDNNSGVGSQLREILQQHAGPGSSVDRRCGGYSSGLSSNNSSSGDDNNNSNNSRLYKFKSNMKHRFSADLEQSHQVRKKRRDSESSCGNYTDYEKDRVTPTGLLSMSRGMLCQDGFSHEPSKLVDGHDSPPLEKTQGSTTPTPKSEGRSSPCRQVPEMGPGGTVPIFALNQNGSFYVPLTIDNALIAPVMAGLSEVSPVLHPISISVNFCGPCPTITSNIGTSNQPNCGGTHPPNAHHLLANRYSHVTHTSALNSYESSIYGGRPHNRVPSDRRRREQYRQTSQYEDHRLGMSGVSENLEKREFGEVDMRDVKDHHHHLHQDHQPKEGGRDLTCWLDHVRDMKDVKDPEKTQENREVRNIRNLRDIRDVREMWEMRDPSQTVREFIDTSGNYSNSVYSRTHPNWGTNYVQPKN